MTKVKWFIENQKDLPQWLRDAECRLVLKIIAAIQKQTAMTANSFIRIEDLKFKMKSMEENQSD